MVHDSIQGNLDTFFPAIRHGIPIDHVEPPTAALEHARRLAQRGVDADSLVRTYRLGHQAVVGIVLDEIRAAQLETPAWTRRIRTDHINLVSLYRQNFASGADHLPKRT